MSRRKFRGFSDREAGNTSFPAVPVDLGATGTTAVKLGFDRYKQPYKWPYKQGL